MKPTWPFPRASAPAHRSSHWRRGARRELLDERQSTCQGDARRAVGWRARGGQPASVGRPVRASRGQRGLEGWWPGVRCGQAGRSRGADRDGRRDRGARRSAMSATTKCARRCTLRRQQGERSATALSVSSRTSRPIVPRAAGTSDVVQVRSTSSSAAPMKRPSAWGWRTVVQCGSPGTGARRFADRKSSASTHASCSGRAPLVQLVRVEPPPGMGGAGLA